MNSKKNLKQKILLVEAAKLMKKIINHSTSAGPINASWYSLDCIEWIKKYNELKKDKA